MSGAALWGLTDAPAIIVAPDVVEALVRAYDTALPLEVCGFLLGPRGRAKSRVTDLVVARGASGHHGAFAIPDHEVRRATAWAEDRRLRILALFHSHPSGDLRLSEGDHAALRYSAWPWVIVARSGKTLSIALAGYRAGDGRRLAVRIANSRPLH